MAVEWKKIAYYEDELLVAEQEVVGRLTGGSLDGIALGIADNNVVQIDGTTNQPVSTDYAKFTASGLEGKSAAEVMVDLSGQAAATFSMNTQKISGVVDPTADQEAATKKYVDDNTETTRTILFVIDGGGAAIATGIHGDIVVDYACTITGVTMLADQSGSIVVDIWKDSYANYPPINADTITSSTPPTITTALKSQDTTLTSWTTAITAGDTLRFNVDSVTTIERVTIALRVTTG